MARMIVEITATNLSVPSPTPQVVLMTSSSAVMANAFPRPKFATRPAIAETNQTNLPTAGLMSVSGLKTTSADKNVWTTLLASTASATKATNFCPTRKLATTLTSAER